MQDPVIQPTRTGFHPDDTTPIPRPSRYYGRRQTTPIAEQLRQPPIDKSVLAIPEPKRLRDKEHLKFVASQPCLICGRQPCDPHHLRFAQPRAIGMKVSDEFTVPLCRSHHSELHRVGNEVAWWEDLEINAMEIARGLWEETHPQLVPADHVLTAPSGTKAVSQTDNGSGGTAIESTSGAEGRPVNEPQAPR